MRGKEDPVLFFRKHTQKKRERDQIPTVLAAGLGTGREPCEEGGVGRWEHEGLG